MQFYVGCSGWSYTAWKGPFYPPQLENSKWLQFYSGAFDYVEIDSSYYRIPNNFMVKNWHNKTPDNFRFTAKFPKVITHDKRLKSVENDLEYFLKVIGEIHDKGLALLLQLPPSLKISEGLEALKNLLPYLDKRFRFAVEVRHRSWFQDLAYNFFANNHLCLVWSQLAELQTPPVVTTDFLYLRFIGDRSIPEDDFGRIQTDRASEMQNWASVLRRIQDEDNHVKLAIVAANNHYAGFGPGTVNLFRSMVNLPPVSWEQQATKDLEQRSLSDFL